MYSMATWAMCSDAHHDELLCMEVLKRNTKLKERLNPALIQNRVNLSTAPKVIPYTTLTDQHTSKNFFRF